MKCMLFCMEVGRRLIPNPKPLYTSVDGGNLAPPHISYSLGSTTFSDIIHGARFPPSTTISPLGLTPLGGSLDYVSRLRHNVIELIPNP